ncbi:hypothetical protein SLE2022_101780 [Rubroshorea leprosula]
MYILGMPGVAAEAELISSIVTIFERIGIMASDVGFKNYGGAIPYLKILEAIEELLQVLSITSLTKLEGWFYNMMMRCWFLISLSKREKLGSAGEAIADLKQLFSLAEEFGYYVWIQFDASIVRGLAYYTGLVFKGFDRKGKLRAICGGADMTDYSLLLEGMTFQLVALGLVMLSL